MKKLIYLLFVLSVPLYAQSQSIPISGDQYHLYGPNTTWGEYLKVGGNGRGTGYASLVTTNGNLHLDAKNGKPIYLNHYGAGNTLMNTSGGKVGIGTASPSANLEIKSGANAHSELHINTTTAGNVSLLRFLHAGTFKWGFLSNYPVSTGNFTLYNYANPSLALTINPSNQIGMGTSTMGSHKLAVEGTIGAREVKVEASGWSDFVFKEDYPLKGLKEVESFIRQNQHLPDIPSEKEVLENGIELGKMDAKLLQKIEELTLYIIQQQKEIENLKAAFDQYKKSKDNE